MVSSINVYFEDEDFKKLLEIKDGKSWQQFILERCLNKEVEE